MLSSPVPAGNKTHMFAQTNSGFRAPVFIGVATPFSDDRDDPGDGERRSCSAGMGIVAICLPEQGKVSSGRRGLPYRLLS